MLRMYAVSRSRPLLPLRKRASRWSKPSGSRLQSGNRPGQPIRLADMWGRIAEHWFIRHLTKIITGRALGPETCGYSNAGARCYNPDKVGGFDCTCCMTTLWLFRLVYNFLLLCVPGKCNHTLNQLTHSISRYAYDNRSTIVWLACQLKRSVPPPTGLGFATVEPELLWKQVNYKPIILYLHAPTSYHL